MRKIYSLIVAAVIALSFTACQQNQLEVGNEVPQHILNKIEGLGFSTKGVLVSGEGFIVERDIYMTEADMATMSGPKATNQEQYSTNNLVATNGSRVITVYMPTGRKGYSAGEQAGLDVAIARYNAENLEISFQRVTSSSAADIVYKRLSKRDERRGVLGSAGFPTASGDPYGIINMSGVLESSYGLNAEEIGSIMGHEMGHCIGMRHTDYFDRSISCGGSTSNEGDGGVGAVYIPGTSTGADLSGNGSWMLACTDGSSRPFTNGDVTALNYLY